jgi:DNA-binding response OmpR family regulator
VLTSGGHCAADDYLSVPFGLEELLSRVQALARPAGVPQPAC